ncbi:MAG: dTMP kinase [Eubacteriales bacterium]|nr:dTMP kinase [Eubacteriales bacterium]MDY3332915.1 dTMP kinase [Gallibacter sp.]
MQKGIFITIEGQDGVGKSTQIEFIKNYFTNKNFDVVLLREPGSTDIGEKIRDILLDKNNKNMSHVTEMFLYAAARSQMVHEKIIPYLEQGKVIICDRYVDSSYAYQEYARNLGDCVRVVNEYATEGVMPDITILLLLDVLESKNRLNKFNKDTNSSLDRIELEGITFQQKVLDGYIAIADRYKDRIKRINASQTIEEVSLDIKDHLDKLLGVNHAL